MAKDKMVRFRDYKNYPKNILEACHFRDDFDDLPDAAFQAVAEEKGLLDALVEMAEWEEQNTYQKEQ